jgi:hypothetical protein
MPDEVLTISRSTPVQSKEPNPIDGADVLLFIGTGLLIIGAALIYIPAALLLAGFILMSIAVIAQIAKLSKVA